MSGINHKTRQESGEGSKLNRGFWVKRVRKPKGNSEIQEADEQIFKGGGWVMLWKQTERFVYM